jgi:ADP-ribosylglycohydrolase
MVSDDTEHALFAAQALLAHPSDPAAFQSCLAWKLRLWLLGLPAGIGLATLRATLKLWIGFPPTRSGVWSAGNGPAMRSAILGAYFADKPSELHQFVRASTRLTHTDPKAETAAQAVATAAAWAVRDAQPAEEWLGSVSSSSGASDAEWMGLRAKLEAALNTKISVEEFADSLGLSHGVTGYAYHTVPVALYAWLRHNNNFADGLAAALNCGGDADTVGAIAGALLGAELGEAGIPRDWVQGICEWPHSVGLIRNVTNRLATQQATGKPLGAVRYCWPGLLPRNLLFLLAVLVHGFRRLAPPY